MLTQIITESSSQESFFLSIIYQIKIERLEGKNLYIKKTLKKAQYKNYINMYDLLRGIMEVMEGCRMCLALWPLYLYFGPSQTDRQKL